MTFAAIYTRPHESGERVTVAETTPDLESALEVLTSVRMNGGVPVGVFKQVPGELVFTAKLVEVIEPKPTKRPKRKAAKLETKPVKAKKRSPRQLAAVQRRVLEYVKAHPGQTVEQIGEAIKKPTKDLVVPMRQLLAEKKIRKRGERRQTRYFVVISRKKK